MTNHLTEFEQQILQEELLQQVVLKIAMSKDSRLPMSAREYYAGQAATLHGIYRKCSGCLTLSEVIKAHNLSAPHVPAYWGRARQ
jgi:hypothetical protein